MSLPGPGFLLVTIGSTFGSKNIGSRRLRRASSDSPCRVGKVAPDFSAVCAAVAKACGVIFMHELARRQVVIGAVVDPEQLRVALDVSQRRRFDAGRVRDDRLEDAAHLERVAMLLVEEDVPSGERRLREVPDQRLLAQRQRGELIRIQLHHRRIVDALEQVFALGDRRGSGRAPPIRGCRRASTPRP